MKRIISFVLVLLICFSCTFVSAERKTVTKDRYYIGAMRVVRCREYVSLREAPYQTAKVLARVPLDSIVLYCSANEKEFEYSPYRAQVHRYYRCEYDGIEGYIQKRFLDKAPEFEPVETKGENVTMTRDEIIGNGEIVLEWKEFNVCVLAAFEVVDENGSSWEQLRVGCFIDDDPTWGYVESVPVTGQFRNLKAFMGGTEDEPQVFVYDAEYGLIMLDLMDGTEGWTLLTSACPLGDAAVVTVGTNTGILYIAGTDGPDPIAISSEGNVLWRSEIDDPDLYGPKEIILNPNALDVVYESGKTAKLEYNGEVISVVDTK